MPLHASSQPLSLSLALQGGGAHGAFTWGVLDALLEDGRMDIEGASGTSAGAMNAAVMADGWLRGGRDGAREALAGFWADIAQQWQQSQLGLPLAGADNGPSPWGRLLQQWASRFSPYELNPLGRSPLREVVEARIDFERLRAASPMRLFIAATEVRTGRLRLFREHELTAPMLLASACLPTLAHAVEIDGRHYWDGGYAANPALSPFLYGEGPARDILLVLLCPLEHRDDPRSAEEIQHRALELGFSSDFRSEVRAWLQACAGLSGGWWPLPRRARRMLRTRLHMVDAGEVDHLYRTDTKLLAHAPFLEELRDQGRACAQAWLRSNVHSVGRRSSIDAAALFG